MPSARITIDTTIGDSDTREYEIEATFSRVIQGRYSGAPEDCYPDEGGELESADYYRLVLVRPDVPPEMVSARRAWNRVPVTEAEVFTAFAESQTAETGEPWDVSRAENAINRMLCDAWEDDEPDEPDYEPDEPDYEPWDGPL